MSDGADAGESLIPFTGLDADDQLSVEEIEAAYQRALETAEALEDLFPDEPPGPVADHETSAPAARDPIPGSSSKHPVDSGDHLELAAHPRHPTPRQVVEALLFVGGEPLTAKKISDVLGGGLSHEQIDEQIEELNREYASQNRPYEIRLVAGGYQMGLRSAFESVRQKVYGQGPKEVKLAPDALEILALVAYRQPITRQELEATDKKNVSGLLRQLLRRELIALVRRDERGQEAYGTTPRFLQLFGLGSIDDLPQAVDFDFK